MPQFGWDEKGAMIGEMGTVLQIFQRNFNFSIDFQPFLGYGTLQENNWNGAIKQILEDDIDFGKFFFCSYDIYDYL